jgi:hypothetical protein
MEIVSTSYTDRRVFSYKPSLNQTDPKVLKVVKSTPIRLENGEIIIPYPGVNSKNVDTDDSIFFYGRRMLKLVDWDNDGDLDLFIGADDHIWYYENVGTKTAPVFKEHGENPGRGQGSAGHAPSRVC